MTVLKNVSEIAKKKISSLDFVSERICFYWLLVECLFLFVLLIWYIMSKISDMERPITKHGNTDIDSNSDDDYIRADIYEKIEEDFKDRNLIVEA